MTASKQSGNDPSPGSPPCPPMSSALGGRQSSPVAPMSAAPVAMTLNQAVSTSELGEGGSGAEPEGGGGGGTFK